MKGRVPFRFLTGTLITLAILCIAAPDAMAIPAFARKYKTSCVTCHYGFPKLNGFGKAFRNNGYRWPGGDENARKEEPVSLGSEGYKKMWPKAVWPSDMPAYFPISLHVVGRTNYTAQSDVKWEFETPHEVELLYGGTLGEHFSFFGEVELENEGGETEIGFPVALQYDHNPALHIRMGAVGGDFADSGARFTRNHYNVASLRTRNGWRSRDDHYGFEVWGAHNGASDRGGFTYKFGVVNGGGLSDNNNAKDFYGRATFKVGGLGEAGGKGEESAASDPLRDDSITMGGFFYKGTASKEGAEDEDFTVYGADAEFWYKNLVASGVLMQMKSEIPGTSDRTSRAFYLQGSYAIYPWLFGLVRYEWRDSDTASDAVKPVTSVIPALTMLARANIKFILELQKFLDDANKDNTTFVAQMQFGL